ncbi:MAG: hypothetical protein DRI46_12980 [Chloroflexi bacterium]|nr:MAG: hypothetical protein DRI46_12980 [Chloroflexota bacterium]
MYTGYEIEAGSRQKLATLFPPKYPNFMGHHITEAFGVKDGSVPEQPQHVLVVAHIDNGEDVEGFVVSIDGSSDRPDGDTYHLTWSLDRSNGAKPVHTNNHIESAKPLKQPIEIDASAKFFTGAGQSYAKGEYRA